MRLSWPFQRSSTVCAYLTSCNTHHRTCLTIIHQKNIPGKFQKDSKNIPVITRTSLVILMDQQSQPKRQTDGQTDRRRQQQYHFSLIGPRGKKWLGNVWQLICWECLSAGLKARSSSPQWVSWKQPLSAVELTPSPSPATPHSWRLYLYQSVGCNYLSILKLQSLHCWNLETDI